MKRKVLLLASVASMIDQFNMQNIRLMQEMGYQVHVACNFKVGNTCNAMRLKKLCRKLRDMRVICHQWDCPRNVVPVWPCLDAYRQLWRLTGRYRYDWMHCQSPIGGALARLVAHKRGIRVIYTAHGFHFYHGAPLKNWLCYYPAEKLLAHWTDVLITINREDYRFAMHKFSAGKVVHIPGVGIDIKKFADYDSLQQRCSVSDREEVCKAYGIPKEAFLMLSIGELSRRKNQIEVITALAAMRRRDVYYMIVGQGEQREELDAYAKRLGVDKYVHFLGFQENVGRLYRSADVFVFPSKQEGMPMALMEAMAAGLACVVSDIRGNRELIAGTERRLSGLYVCCGGIRYHPGAVAQLQEALEIMRTDLRFRKRCGRYNGRRIIPYSQEEAGMRMKAIYHEATS